MNTLLDITLFKHTPIFIYQGVHCCTKVSNLQYYNLLYYELIRVVIQPESSGWHTPWWVVHKWNVVECICLGFIKYVLVYLWSVHELYSGLANGRVLTVEFYTHINQKLTLKVLNFWKFTRSCSLKNLWSGMGEVVPARTSPTLHPPSPPTVHQLSWLAFYELILLRLFTDVDINSPLILGCGEIS